MFYKVVVTHGNDTENKMVTPKEIYELAKVVYLTECRNAGGYLADKPGSITVQLFKPDGIMEKQMRVISDIV